MYIYMYIYIYIYIRRKPWMAACGPGRSTGGGSGTPALVAASACMHVVPYDSPLRSPIVVPNPTKNPLGSKCSLFKDFWGLYGYQKP